MAWCRGSVLLLVLQWGVAGTGHGELPCPGEGLEVYIGSYQSVQLLNDPRVAIPLRRLLGTHLPHFKRNLEVAGPVDLISGHLAVSGNAPHQGGLEEAVLCVSLRDASVSAALLSSNRIRIYTPHERYDQISRCIKDWISSANVGHNARLVMPDNVILDQAAGETTQ